MGRKSDARERILRAAAGLIHARGYNGIGIQEICDAAGVNKGSFYYFFRTKRELLLALIDVLSKHIALTLFAPIEARNLPPRETIRAVFQEYAAGSLAAKGRDGVMKGCPIGNLVIEMAAQEPEAGSRLRAALEQFAGHMEKPLRQAMDDGEIPRADPRRLARSLTAYFQGITLLAKAENSPETISSLADGALRLAGFPIEEDSPMTNR